MFKIKKQSLIIISILIIGIFLISSCGGECTINSDCQSKKCQTVKCIDKKCQYTTLKNCCGNGIKEEIEDGKEGNKCTCPTDYGKCEGKGKLTLRGREIDTTYLKYLCKNDKCVLSYDGGIVTEIPLVTENEFSYFKLESAVNFNKPLDIDKDKFKVRFTLKDDHEDLVYPLKLTNIKFISGSIMLGESLLTIEFNKVGDFLNIEIPVTYQLEQIEEELQVSYKVDYEFTKRVKVRQPDGTYGYEIKPPERGSFENRLSERVYFINPGEESE